jgi:hypothetical protein
MRSDPASARGHRKKLNGYVIRSKVKHQGPENNSGQRWGAQRKEAFSDREKAS